MTKSNPESETLTYLILEKESMLKSISQIPFFFEKLTL